MYLCRKPGLNPSANISSCSYWESTPSACAFQGPACSLPLSPDRIRTTLLQWMAFICEASFVLCHAYHASLVWLRRTKAYEKQHFIVDSSNGSLKTVRF